jgi:hypothetical protein
VSQVIGRQDGIEWFVGFVSKIPLVKYRPPEKRPASLEQWYGLEKLERTLRILKDDHDAAIVVVPEPPPPPPPPPPAAPRLAPMTHYAVPRADARYCVRAPGVTQIGPDTFRDEGGFTYTENGLCGGGRSGKFVAVLKPADSMDGLEPCDGYTKDGRTFPPWPPESYEV